MKTIEEAFVALGIVLRWESRVKMCRDVDGDDVDLSWLDEEQAAIRTVALAVLEEAFNWVRTERASHYMAVRAQIEALGE